MSVRARMKVQSINGSSVNLSAVYSSDPDDPNYSYSQATPSANLSMYISNPAALEEFSEGDVFDLTFQKLVPPAAQPGTSTASTS